MFTLTGKMTKSHKNYRTAKERAYVEEISLLCIPGCRNFFIFPLLTRRSDTGSADTRYTYVPANRLGKDHAKGITFGHKCDEEKR